jgi:hypothetical protein
LPLMRGVGSLPLCKLPPGWTRFCCSEN